MTSGELKIAKLDDRWTQFTATAPEGAFVSTFEVWRDGRALSVMAIGGERDDKSWSYTESAVLDMVSVRTTTTPEQLVVMWQNCRLPEEFITKRTNNIFGVRIPKNALDMERSAIRVFAVGGGARFNDLYIPLANGRAVDKPSQLNRGDQQAQVLYSLMIDRFYNALSTNDKPLNRADVLPQVDYQGGDFKGITEKIKAGFFNELGITTIWISPITQNPWDAWGQNRNPNTRFSGYHGYWPLYVTRLEERFGTPDELKEMLSVAHKHGMNVILDYVANHMHINSPTLQQNPDWITPLVLPDGSKNLSLWDGEQRLTTWFDEHIPTLDLERVEVCEPMTDSAMYWLAEYDFDGFRHDACKHIPEQYWRMLTAKMKRQFPDRELWQIGETYGSPELINSYISSGMIDAQFDFNVYHTALDVFTQGQPISRLAEVVRESSEVYGAHHTMGNITGNHDKARLISLAGGTLDPAEDHKLAGWNRSIGVGDPVGYDKLLLHSAMIMTIPGVPCIYQGDEYGEPGGNDPDNRRMMRFEGYNERETQQLVQTMKLTNLRRNNLPLIYGDMLTLKATDDIWLFVRIYMGEYTIIAFNNGEQSQRISCKLPSGFNVNQKLIANFGANFTLLPDSTFEITLEPNRFEILTKN